MKTEISKHILGKMLSKESTELVIKEIAVKFLEWVFLNDYKFTCEGSMWVEEEKQSIASIFEYWIDNIYKID